MNYIAIVAFEIAQELWNLLVPLDPASTFPKDRLGWWLDFLIENGSKVVSKDTWNLVSLTIVPPSHRIPLSERALSLRQFLEFTRTIDPNFEQYDEEGTSIAGSLYHAALVDDHLPLSLNSCVAIPDRRFCRKCTSAIAVLTVAYSVQALDWNKAPVSTRVCSASFDSSDPKPLGIHFFASPAILLSSFSQIPSLQIPY